MVWVDYLIIGIIALSAVISVVRGFIKEVFSLASWIVAIWVGLVYYSYLATLLVDYINTPSLRALIAFAALFVITLVLGALISHLFSQLVSKTGLSGTDRSLGIIFGTIRGVAIVTVLVIAASLTPMPSDQWWQDSQLLPHFEKLAVWIQSIVPNDITNKIKF